MISNEKWYWLSNYPLAFKFTNRADGLYAWYDLVAPNPYLSAKFPALKGDSYALLDGGPVRNAVVLSIDTLVTVPAGQFHCYLYEFRFMSDSTLQFEGFRCPGVGNVLLNSYTKKSDGTVYLSTQATLLSVDVK